jgi:hypothetical protein
LIGPLKKKHKPVIVFEAQSTSTNGPVFVEKFYKKCEVCELFTNSEKQWEIHIAGEYNKRYYEKWSTDQKVNLCIK